MPLLDKEHIRRQVEGALAVALDAHGAIDEHLIQSAAKRVAGQIHAEINRTIENIHFSAIMPVCTQCETRMYIEDPDAQHVKCVCPECDFSISNRTIFECSDIITVEDGRATTHKRRKSPYIRFERDNE